MKKILIFTLLLAGYFTSFAQNDSTKYVHYKYQYGSWMDRYRADKVLSIPKDTSFSKDGIAVLNGLFYIGNGIKWTQLVSGTGTIATGNTFVVTNETAMLALSTAVVGDVAVTTDSSKSFILQSLPSSSLSNWVQLLFPSSVPSVFGRTGPISAQYSDYSSFYQAIISNLSDTSKYLKKIDTTGQWVNNIYTRADSLFKLKNGEETFLRKAGISQSTIDSILGGYYTISQVDSITAQLRTEIPDISGKVNYTDSNNIYVTPSQLAQKVDTSYKDTLEATGVVHINEITPTHHQIGVNLSTDTTFSNASDDSVPSSLAVKKKLKADSIALQNSISVKKDNSDSTNATTGYTTLYQNGLKVDKSDSTIANRITNLQNTKANDNNVFHLTGNESGTGTKTFNNSFQVNSNSISYWGQDFSYGYLSWDVGRAIVGAVTGKNLSFVTGAGYEALGLDQTGNAVIRGTVTGKPATDSAKLAQLGQIYPSTKKWVIFGDSFSSDDTKYWGTVRDKLKLTGIVTNAVSGNKISQQSAKLDSILAANPTYFNTFDICSILIGINDFAASQPLGTINDTAGRPTYAGYLKHMIETILTAKPTIELYVMTPPEANGAGVAYKATNSAGWTVQQMSVLIARICYQYSVQCIDLYAYSQFNLKTIPTLTYDGLHPNANGSKFLGNMIAEAFVVRQNFGKYIPNLKDVTQRDSSTTTGLSLANGNLLLKRDGTIWWGLPSKQSFVSWDTVLNHNGTIKTIIGTPVGQTGYMVSFFVNGIERMTIDSNGIAKASKFVVGKHTNLSDADSLTLTDKKYVDSKFVMGTATLASGTVTVSTTAVKTGAKIFVSFNTPSGTQGFLSAPSASIVDGTSFVINSSSSTDNSTVNWQIINP